MYSGTTMTPFSGELLGAHQKIDRTARTQLEELLPNTSFPNWKMILKFEGNNGPDGVKRKSPGKDEPWHFMLPFDMNDTQVIDLIEYHYKELVRSLKKKDDVRSAFEAAWLAHAVVDGLTPAHHYPYEEKLMEFGVQSGTRSSVFRKLVQPGGTIGEQLSNNWQMWGPKGLMTAHGFFEWGFALILKTLKLDHKPPTTDKIRHFKAVSLGTWYRETAQDIARMGLYDEFQEKGWTLPLTRKMRSYLAPTIVHAVTLVWYGAVCDAKLQSKGNENNFWKIRWPKLRK